MQEGKATEFDDESRAAVHSSLDALMAARRPVYLMNDLCGMRGRDSRVLYLTPKGLAATDAAVRR
jgi:hypothetical protein